MSRSCNRRQRPERSPCALEQLEPQGLSTPAWVGPLTAYIAPWNGMNVAGFDAQGQIRVLWWAPGQTFWAVDNLSLITNMPALAGSLTSSA